VQGKLNTYNCEGHLQWSKWMGTTTCTKWIWVCV